jgi:hypothetical protein
MEDAVSASQKGDALAALRRGTPGGRPCCSGLAAAPRLLDVYLSEPSVARPRGSQGTRGRPAESVFHLAGALDKPRALRIEFVSLHEAVDTSTPMGRAMFHIAGAFAELEREIIRERVRAGLQNAKLRGKRLGRRRAVVNVRKSSREHRASQAALSRRWRASRRQL